MTAPAFTPGPWRWTDESGYRSLVRSDHGLIANLLKGDNSKRPDEEREANARLIAAAPDGYTAADNSVARLETLLAYTTTLTSDDQAVVQECIDDLRGFLAKARGEQ